MHLFQSGARIREQVERVVHHYMLEDITGPGTSLIHWKLYEKSDDFVKRSPAEIAKEYLTPVATTVDVERLFSEAGDILTTERNRLKPQNARKILMTREGLPLVNFKY